jgi:hypothetical protein
VVSIAAGHRLSVHQGPHDDPCVHDAWCKLDVARLGNAQMTVDRVKVVKLC